MKNVTVFPNQQKNADTIIFLRDYEENEAPPPRLDVYAHDGVVSNGQFLFKNQIENQEIIKKMAEQKKQEYEVK